VKRGVEENISKRASILQSIYKKGRAAWQKQNEGESGGGFWVFAAQKLIFGKIRERFGSNLRGLVCGSAPLPLKRRLLRHARHPHLAGLRVNRNLRHLHDGRPAHPVRTRRVGQSVPESK